ncbi:hypothetical protein HDV05_008230 [Chytridiales sp. JEL 0842]|nr:hypothetical protein HDV05_008230 [Chytridiales sp. JEL 0842]
MPYDLFSVGKGDFTLERTANSVGAYSFIVLMAPMTSLTPSQQNRLTSYLTAYNIRLVRLGDQPDPSTGVSAFNGQGSGDNQPVYLTADGVPLATAAGVQPSILLSTAGLFHVPSKITNPATAKAVLMFQKNAAFPEDTVAAALITYPTYQQLSFYLPFGFWSLTSMVLGHIWFSWGTRGFYPGYRRIMFSTHVDDVFLSTNNQANQPAYRISAADMAAVQKWQTDINKRMNTGSSFKLDLAFNGNGVFAETNTKLASVKQVDLDDIAYFSVNKEFKKPLGTGIDVWAPIDLNPYSVANVAANLPNFLRHDALFNFLYTNQAQYFWNSHSFTHEDLNNCTYRDAFNEITVNQNFAKGIQLDSKSYFSKHSIVSPAISGVFNGDAIRAFKDAGITSVVGDITRPNINNNTNPHWPFITSMESSNNAGFTIIPRAATAIYFNCSTPQENEALYARIYPAQPLNFRGILNAEVERTVYKLMNLHWDAYMFHQVNLRTADLSTAQNPPPGPTAPLSTFNSGVNVPGTRNGATAAYTGGNISILGSWVEAVVQEFNRYVNWPMVTFKMDDMEDLFNARVVRETAGVVVNVAARPDGFTQFTVTSARPCTAPISFPPNVAASNIVGLPAAWKTEKLGSDPLTVWVPLDGRTPVTITLNVKVAY